ncbi:ABC transporter substrate-binding protein [Clostridium sp. CTA-7]
MKKRILALLLTGLISSTALVGCNKSGDAASNKKLVISTWGLNEDVLKETVFEPFAKEHGVEIVLEVGNNSERLTKMKNNPNSNIDITYLAESFAEQGIEAGIFEKIDYSKIPNAENMNEKAKATVERGYGPAYTLNSIGIVVDPSAGIEINSWEDLWKPELKNKIAIPDITTTNGPAIVDIAAIKAGVDIKSDKGEAAFKELEALKPNVVKTYSKSSDLANMFSSGEIVAAVASDFAYDTIAKAKPGVKNIVPESGTYLNFNTININKNSKNKELAYEFINYALSPEVQEKTAKALKEAPVNTEVKLTEEDSKNLTYGAVVDNAKIIDFKFVNPLMEQWINTWNRIMN